MSPLGGLILPRRVQQLVRLMEITPYVAQIFTTAHDSSQRTVSLRILLPRSLTRDSAAAERPMRQVHAVHGDEQYPPIGIETLQIDKFAVDDVLDPSSVS